eukprot:TRINITY_DN353_c0_g1_i4.p1 TRINITY_DN353_c0_g1~~TRINITY_DN353_c0_g1_i4.p1  ORF type:complete len:278 (+),score=71.08 TRINITY_DN353_c0_g1_i4:52-885(+)
MSGRRSRSRSRSPRRERRDRSRSRERSRSPRRDRDRRDRSRSKSPRRDRSRSRSPVLRGKRSKIVYCGNLRVDTSFSDLKKLFEQHGEVTKIDLKDGFAFVFMAAEEQAESAIRKFDRYTYEGRMLRCEFARGDGAVKVRENVRKEKALANPTDTLFVVGFDSKTTERDLRKAFEVHGEISDVQIKKNFAFVQFANVPAAQSAYNVMDGSVLNDRQLTVEFRASPGGKRPRSPSPYRRRSRSRSPESRRRRSPSPRRSPRYNSSRRSRSRSRSRGRY